MASQRFDTAVFQSQAVFRAAMLAMSRPGQIQVLAHDIAGPLPLMPASAALALALCDFETPIWLDSAMQAGAGIADYLRFETGAPIVPSPEQAHFALIADTLAMPAFAAFALGTLSDPDRSTTLILQVEALHNDQGWSLSGPGIIGRTQLHVAPFRADSLDDVRDMRQLYPRGVDLFFVQGNRIAGLPRSVLIEA